MAQNKRILLSLILFVAIFNLSSLLSKINIETLTFNYWPLLDINKFNTLKNNINTLQKNDSFIPPNIYSCPIIPHVQKLIIKEPTNLYFIGSIFGNKSDLLDLLKINENFKLPENSYLIFLGNYVDGGFDGLMILTTIMLLKIKNPNNVFVIRGKHENSEINKQCGFHKELSNKETEQEITDLINQINIFYELMPAAIYINYYESKFFHASHAGIEIRYNPQKFLDANKFFDANNDSIKFDLLNIFPRTIFTSNLIAENLGSYNYCDIENPIFGFLWNDFIYDETCNENNENKSTFLNKLLNKNNINLKKNWVKGGIKHNYKIIKKIFKEYGIKNTFTKFICSSNHKIPKTFTFNKRTNKLNPEELNLQTEGISPTNKKIITVISTSIRYPENEIKYIPSFLHIPISYPKQKEQFYEQNI